jgi:hypothetical protein
MRLLPSYQAVEFMRAGMTPQAACEGAMRRILSKYSTFNGALICANKAGAGE